MMSRIDAYLLDVERLSPEVQRIIGSGFRGLSKKQRRKVEQIARIIEETQQLRTEYQRLCFSIEDGRRVQSESERVHSRGGLNKESRLEPASRLQQLRRNIENQSAAAVPKIIIERLQNWESEVNETCGRLLLEDLEGASSELQKQKLEWQKALAEAQYGSPGLRGRFLALRYHLRYRALKNEVASSKMKLSSWNKVLVRKREGCESLAGAVLTIFRLFSSMNRSISSYGSSTRRFEKIMKLQIENEIMHGIRRRGNSILAEIRKEESLRQQKLKFLLEARHYVSSRENLLSDLRAVHATGSHQQPTRFIELGILRSFASSTAALDQESLNLKGRLEALSHELEFQKSALVSRIERIARYLPYEPGAIDEMIKRKVADSEAFVLPSKEARTRS